MTIIVANSAKYFNSSIKKIFNQIESVNVIFISDKNELTHEFLKKLSPKFVFFIHWSYLVPSNIYENFECIVFHMTDLPFGRGGSPLQNLITRGINETKISAIKCVEELDAGDIYIKRNLSLCGNAQEIYIRANNIITEMIEFIVTNEITPMPQVGEVVKFERRKPTDSNIEQLTNLEDIYDYIRMLDADGYPKAFLEHNGMIFEFERASFRGDFVKADVIIRRKN